MQTPTTTVITAKNAGMRLDKYLAQLLGLSRREVLLLLEHNCITLNKKTVGTKVKGQLLSQNDQLSITNYKDILSTTIQPNPDINLDVLSDGSDYLVVNKVAGMPVMPLKATETHTVLNAVAAHYPQVQDVGQSGGEGGLGSGVVHRLDTDTSGTLVIATEETRWQNLRTAFKNHETTKRYRAIVHGKLKGSGTERMNLVIAQHKPAKVRVVTRPEQANSSERECNLSWQSIETGHPVVGDKLYGLEHTKKMNIQAQRQMLHASYLKVMDIEAHSPDPEDFITLLGTLK